MKACVQFVHVQNHSCCYSCWPWTWARDIRPMTHATTKITFFFSALFYSISADFSKINRNLASRKFNGAHCLEPFHRFASEKISDTLTHNYQTIEKEEHVCEFCGTELLRVVNKVCCTSYSRNRRESELFEFYNNSTNSSNEIFLPHLKDSPRGATIVDHQTPSCLSDRTVEIFRRKRDLEKKDHWTLSQLNGGKGRSSINEILANITCPPTEAKSLLSSTKLRSFGGKTNKKNTRFQKHTFLQRECCSDGQECNQFELHETNLSEECCKEGCRLEEIVESCGSWRWDKN